MFKYDFSKYKLILNQKIKYKINNFLKFIL